MENLTREEREHKLRSQIMQRASELQITFPELRVISEQKFGGRLPKQMDLSELYRFAAEVERYQTERLRLGEQAQARLPGGSHYEHVSMSELPAGELTTDRSGYVH